MPAPSKKVPDISHFLHKQRFYSQEIRGRGRGWKQGSPPGRSPLGQSGSLGPQPRPCPPDVPLEVIRAECGPPGAVTGLLPRQAPGIKEKIKHLLTNSTIRKEAWGKVRQEAGRKCSCGPPGLLAGQGSGSFCATAGGRRNSCACDQGAHKAAEPLSYPHTSQPWFHSRAHTGKAVGKDAASA